MGVGKRQALGWREPSGRKRAAPAAPARGSASSAARSVALAPGRSSESSLSRRQKRPRARWSSSVSFSPLPRRSSSATTWSTVGWRRAAPAEPSPEQLSSTRTSVSIPSAARSTAIASRQRTRSSRWAVLTMQYESSGGTCGLLSRALRVSVVDPAAFTPPYDRALCAALAAEGLEVELLTRPFRHGDVPAATPGWTLREGAFGATRAHPVNMLRLGRRARGELLHFQWLPLQELDQGLLPRGRPLVLTAHDVLPREPRRFQLRAQRRLYERVDAVVAHTEHARGRLLDLGIDPGKVEVIPHGAFTHLASTTPARPPELPEPERPVVLFFGLLRPYKGLDVLLEAWRALDADAELWVVGNPRMALPPLPPRARLVPRFVTEAEAAWCFDRAAVVALPYREIEGSGVLFTALGAGKATVVSDVGGFGELGDAVVHVPPGEPGALAAALARLVADPAAREAQGAAAARAAAERFGWAAVARAHRVLYARLLQRA